MSDWRTAGPHHAGETLFANREADAIEQSPHVAMLQRCPGGSWLHRDDRVFERLDVRNRTFAAINVHKWLGEHRYKVKWCRIRHEVRNVHALLVMG